MPAGDTFDDGPGLNTPLVLPCGARLLNRLAKAAMSEQLASRRNEPSPRLTALYRRWGASGAGLLITGNVMVDRRAVSEPRQAAVEGGHEAAFKSWAAAATHGGAHAWVQLNHPGRQVPRLLDSRPPGPSAVRLSAPRVLFGTPQEMTESQIAAVIARFAAASRAVIDAGFTGVQIHAAHGYLLSQFLSRAANLRSDRWGGGPIGADACSWRWSAPSGTAWGRPHPCR
jgi:2,4-dienoyl-CoA reductase-like NADH-dependent reductase (Old Yellow Enzyme family)